MSILSFSVRLHLPDDGAGYPARPVKSDIPGVDADITVHAAHG